MFRNRRLLLTGGRTHGGTAGGGRVGPGGGAQGTGAPWPEKEVTSCPNPLIPRQGPQSLLFHDNPRNLNSLINIWQIFMEYLLYTRCPAKPFRRALVTKVQKETVTCLGHTANKQQSWDCKPGAPASGPLYLLFSLPGTPSLGP